MSPKLLSPPEIILVHDPVIFLAGPIQGTWDWQEKAIELLDAASLDAYVIANPRREYLDGSFVYEKQVDWETHYLRKASDEGVLLFWLAKEQHHDPGRSYAQTSRYELAEWITRSQYDPLKLVIGIEEGFSGAKYIRRRVSQDNPGIPILSTLEETCDAALRELRTAS